MDWINDSSIEIVKRGIAVEMSTKLLQPWLEIWIARLTVTSARSCLLEV